MRSSRHRLVLLLLCACLGAGGLAPAQARSHHASGRGTNLLEPGIRSEFQFTKSHVLCKVGHAVMPDGTHFQMSMFSTDIDSVTIDSLAKTVTITGTMVSIVDLRSPDGTAEMLMEVVPFVAFGEDNGTPGAGKDYFELMVVYNPYLPSPNQFEFFGGSNPVTFAGVLASGNVVVR
jgi:hypothetical protein